MQRYLSVLSIAGSDSGGGAGIQADIKTISALGGFACTVITAVTSQNTQGLSGFEDVSPKMVQHQLQAIFNDIEIDAVKIGMLANEESVSIIAESLKDFHQRGGKIILDPVMVASSGDSLTRRATVQQIKEKIFPLASLITPNLDEAQVLCNFPIRNIEEMRKAADCILSMNCEAVLIKGGHLSGTKLSDLLKMQGHPQDFLFTHTRIETSNTHGTGCSLSSAIAVYCAQGLDLVQAVKKACEYIHEAIKAGASVSLGQGKGPIQHFYLRNAPIIKQK